MLFQVFPEHRQAILIFFSKYMTASLCLYGISSRTARMSIPAQTALYCPAGEIRIVAAESNPGLSSTALPMSVFAPKMPCTAGCRPLYPIKTINGGSLRI